MEFKGTQGKWKIFAFKAIKNNGPDIRIVDKKMNDIASCNIFINDLDSKTNKANAKLISKAPELLNIILVLVDLIEKNNLGHLSEVEKAKVLIKKSII